MGHSERQGGQAEHHLYLAEEYETPCLGSIQRSDGGRLPQGSGPLSKGGAGVLQLPAASG